MNKLDWLTDSQTLHLRQVKDEAVNVLVKYANEEIKGNLNKIQKYNMPFEETMYIRGKIHSMKDFLRFLELQTT